jgi:hypothetical protein
MTTIQLSSIQLAILGFAALFLWVVGTVVYRRFLHPLAKIPGPFLPAATRSYTFYYNFILEGQYYKEIERMHRLYGTSAS